MPKAASCPEDAAPRSTVSGFSPETPDKDNPSSLFPLESTNLVYRPSRLERILPLPLVPVPQPNSDRVRQQQHDHQNDYTGCGRDLEPLLRLRDPGVDLDGERAVTARRTFGGEVYVGRGPDDDEGRRLTDSAREREDRAGKCPGEGHRQEVAPDHLPARRPQSEAPLAYGAGYGAQCLPGGDYDYGQDEQAQGQGARDEALPTSHRSQQVDEDAQAQETVDYGRNAGQV